MCTAQEELGFFSADGHRPFYLSPSSPYCMKPCLDNAGVGGPRWVCCLLFYAASFSLVFHLFHTYAHVLYCYPLHFSLPLSQNAFVSSFPISSSPFAVYL
eukprot:RCo018616